MLEIWHKIWPLSLCTVLLLDLRDDCISSHKNSGVVQFLFRFKFGLFQPIPLSCLTDVNVILTLPSSPLNMSVVVFTACCYRFDDIICMDKYKTL